MAVNKVTLGDQTLIDLTADSVTPDKLSKGITAHNMKGESIVGTMESSGGTPNTPWVEYDNYYEAWMRRGSDQSMPSEDECRVERIKLHNFTQVPRRFLNYTYLYHYSSTEYRASSSWTTKNAIIDFSGSDDIEVFPKYSIVGVKINRVIFPANLKTIESNAVLLYDQAGYLDFSRCKQIPILKSKSGMGVFKERGLTPSSGGISSLTQGSFGQAIIVPDALYDEWRIATNWSSGRGIIKKASEVTG